MVERRPLATAISHLVLVLGVLIVAFPIYLTFIASTHTAREIAQQAPMSLLPGDNFYWTFPNLYTIRGTPFRSLKNWYRSIDAMRDLEAACMVPGHGRPVAKGAGCRGWAGS